jgi:hypothetical protein
VDDYIAEKIDEEQIERIDRIADYSLEELEQNQRNIEEYFNDMAKKKNLE